MRKIARRAKYVLKIVSDVMDQMSNIVWNVKKASSSKITNKTSDVQNVMKLVNLVTERDTITAHLVGLVSIYQKMELVFLAQKDATSAMDSKIARNAKMATT